MVTYFTRQSFVICSVGLYNMMVYKTINNWLHYCNFHQHGVFFFMSKKQKINKSVFKLHRNFHYNL